ncbi:hypothetical protein Syun_026357 [Stephania yunnanensis]|uniref:Protein kinase domain-containing protein n=1 Tax=Stephania yunnanensis TaxID=152371 RepID=A0AAP0HVN3_9MAGN
MPQKGIEPGHNALPPNKRIPKQLPRKWFHSPASSPSASSNDHSSAVVSSPAPGPSYQLPRPNFVPRAPSEPPTRGPGKSRQMHHNPPTAEDGLSASPPSSFPSIGSSVPPVAAPPSAVPSGETRRPVLSPKISPFGSYTKNPKAPLPAQVLILPPPPPNRDCSSLTCTEPLTNRPPGAPCGCVVPMRVGLQLSVALYTFFPLVSELAKEIASGVFMKQSQVRITGANAASVELDKTVVFIDLVPLGDNFDASLALLTYNRFWHKQVIIQRSFFGEYQVLYVKYSGLPPSPPSAPLSVSTIDGGPHFGKDNSATMLHPLGVDVKKNQKDGLSGSMIAIIVLSSSIALGLCIGVAWLLLLKGAKGNADRNGCLPKLTSPTSGPSSVKPTGGVGSKTFESGLSSAAASFSSSIAAYAGTAKTFTLGEMERATNNFDSLTILGEGGFGRVYRGDLDDGTKVAIKVLKRDDHQGGREFMAEVEMLSRLHHRNLVKLIGICIEGHARCLVYELIPNSSLESHLHGVDKGTAPLDWGARMKIALGAARGLAYLHEDSSPRVIHRDFKASNILLEDDDTPKVSDFGLARAALDEESKHISTRVMGTFGYVAPEYAMTGHLLVKSDVYSYGVVLLELLTGRKPVDMSQPPGQENLVAWARPLLTSKEGLEMIIDPSLGSGFPFDCVAKVAAIASMCVQPEVSHRPFMGEVVQALKLVCEECEETRELGSECCSQDDSSTIDKDSKVATTSGHAAEQSGAHHPMLNYFTLDNQRALSASDIFNRSATFGRQTSGSFRRHSSSGPLSSWRSKQVWDRIRGTSRGSVSEHGFAFKFWPRSH